MAATTVAANFSRGITRPSHCLRILHQSTFSRQSLNQQSIFRFASQPATRNFASTMSFKTPSSDPPKHEAVYFPNMTNSLPAESGDFRRVLWTGLYSQLVLMTVPADGDIGDEVMTSLRCGLKSSSADTSRN